MEPARFKYPSGRLSSRASPCRAPRTVPGRGRSTLHESRHPVGRILRLAPRVTRRRAGPSGRAGPPVHPGTGRGILQVHGMFFAVISTRYSSTLHPHVEPLLMPARRSHSAPAAVWVLLAAALAATPFPVRGAGVAVVDEFVRGHGGISWPVPPDTASPDREPEWPYPAAHPPAEEALPTWNAALVAPGLAIPGDRGRPWAGPWGPIPSLHEAGDRRPPPTAVPPLRTKAWPALGLTMGVLLAAARLAHRHRRGGPRRRSPA